MGELLQGISADTLRFMGIVTAIILVSILKDFVKSKFFKHNPNFQTLDDKLDDIKLILTEIKTTLSERKK